MLTVRPVHGTGQFVARISNGFIGAFVYGSSPRDALSRLERHSGLPKVYRPYVTEIRKRVIGWQLSETDLYIGINTGTIVLPSDWQPR